MSHNHDGHNMDPTTTPCPFHAAKMKLMNSTVAGIVSDLIGSSSNVIAKNNHHNHHNHHNHGAMLGDGNSSDDDMMMMYFHGGYKEVILFDFWRTRSILIFVISCISLFIIAALYEGIKLLRESLIRHEINAANASLNEQNSDENARSLLNQNAATSYNNNNNNNNVGLDIDVKTSNNRNDLPTDVTVVSLRQANLFQKRSRLLSRGHIIQTFLHMFQVTISYLLMLVFMTYNSWLCLSVVLGAGVGYFFFGYKRLTTIDANEHCH